MMIDTIVVRDVLEHNDCAGKKFLTVTSSAEDETVRPLYRLNHGWLPPSQKLALASVAPMDHVRVVEQFHHDNLLMAGEFVEVVADTHLRDSICRCGTMLVSDGFDLHCPNNDCPLTLTARFERLARTDFFNFDAVMMHNDYTSLDLTTSDDIGHFCHPFMFVSHGIYWGNPGGSLPHLLLNYEKTVPSISTFLVPELFHDFITERQIDSFLKSKAINNTESFYGWMNEVINRRDVYCNNQNKILYGFIWSLGIEALIPRIINSMLHCEADVAINDPATVYSHLLTNPRHLTESLSIHPLEAAAIVNEVRRRKYELFDILHHYALNKKDVIRSFNDVM